MLAISKDILAATPRPQAKVRSLAYDNAAFPFKCAQVGAPKAQAVSSYITQGMLDLQKNGGSFVKHVGSKDTTLEDNKAKHVEMIMVLPADSALEAIGKKCAWRFQQAKRRIR